MMFNCKVSPDEYLKLRRTLLDFLSTNKLTINESMLVLQVLSSDLQDQICSGELGIEEHCTFSTDGECKKI